MKTATTHFGDREVPEDQKESLVRGVFDSVAARYDLMNDVMSAGMHRLWKSAMVAAIPLYRNMRLLDLAGGTGDIAFRFVERYESHYLDTLSKIDPANGRSDATTSERRERSLRGAKEAKLLSANYKITVCDINAAMLEEGKKRAIDRNLTAPLEWVEGNAEALPFDDNHFDACTIAFGIRNVTHIDRALAEIHRVLKPGGKFLCLEFSPVGQGAESREQGAEHVQTSTPRTLHFAPFATLYNLYSDHVIPMMGDKITNDRTSYEYLVQSIRRFPAPEPFAAMIREAGFRRVDYRRMTGGVVALHTGWKI